MLDDGAVARKLFLERLHQLFLIELVVDALHGGQRLAAIALLYANVNEAAAQADIAGVLVFYTASSRISEWIWRDEYRIFSKRKKRKTFYVVT